MKWDIAKLMQEALNSNKIILKKAEDSLSDKVKKQKEELSKHMRVYELSTNLNNINPDIAMGINYALRDFSEDITAENSWIKSFKNTKKDINFVMDAGLFKNIKIKINKVPLIKTFLVINEESGVAGCKKEFAQYISAIYRSIEQLSSLYNNSFSSERVNKIFEQIKETIKEEKKETGKNIGNYKNILKLFNIAKKTFFNTLKINFGYIERAEYNPFTNNVKMSYQDLVELISSGYSVLVHEVDHKQRKDFGRLNGAINNFMKKAFPASDIFQQQINLGSILNSIMGGTLNQHSIFSNPNKEISDDYAEHINEISESGERKVILPDRLTQMPDLDFEDNINYDLEQPYNLKADHLIETVSRLGRYVDTYAGTEVELTNGAKYKIEEIDGLFLTYWLEGNLDKHMSSTAEFKELAHMGMILKNTSKNRIFFLEYGTSIVDNSSLNPRGTQTV